MIWKLECHRIHFYSAFFSNILFSNIIRELLIFFFLFLALWKKTALRFLLRKCQRLLNVKQVSDNNLRRDSQAGWSSEQPDLVDSIPTHSGEGLGTRWSLWSLSTPKILLLYEIKCKASHMYIGFLHSLYRRSCAVLTSLWDLFPVNLMKTLSFSVGKTHWEDEEVIFELRDSF